MSFFSDEGLDLSQHTLTDTMFVGPELDADGEEVITGKSQFNALVVNLVPDLQRQKKKKKRKCESKEKKNISIEWSPVNT